MTRESSRTYVCCETTAYLFIRLTFLDTTTNCSPQLRTYGSWRKALTAAGIKVPDSPHDGRRGVLRALRYAFEQHLENAISEKLKLHAAYYFGSLAKAMAALKRDRSISAGWNKTKITTVLNRMHTAKRALGYAAARRDNTALVNAAEAYFGTWGNALHAAGIDPNLYFRRKWRKRRTTAKRDQTRYGKLLNSPVSAL